MLNELYTSVAAAMVNFNTSPTDTYTERRHMKWNNTGESKMMTNTTKIIGADTSMNG